MFPHRFWLALALALLPWFGAAQPVGIPDPQLRAALAAALSLPDGAEITRQDLETLRQFAAPNRLIGNLSGLEWATNLATLALAGNAIQELSPIAGLPFLNRLDISRNHVADFSPLAGLSNLRFLALDENPGADLWPLAELPQLAGLSAAGVGLTDLSFLAELSALTDVNLARNRVADVAPVAGLAHLSRLDLRGNALANPEVLANATSLTYLCLGATELAGADFLAPLTQLTFLNLDHNHLVDATPLAGLTNLTYLALSDNPITNFSVLSALTGLVNLELRGDALTSVAFLSNCRALSYADLAYNNLVDLSPLGRTTNLNLVVDGNTALRRTSLAALTNVSRLWLNDCGLTNFEFLQPLVRLEALGLDQNQISDLAPLARFPNLRRLGVSWNPLLSLDPISNLTNLVGLRLEGDQVADARVLSGLKRLEFLALNDNRLSDLSPLTPLSRLASLDLSHNYLTNLNALTKFPELAWVDVSLELFDPRPGSLPRSIIDELQSQGVRVIYQPVNQLTVAVALAPAAVWHIPLGRTSTLRFYPADLVVPVAELLAQATSSDFEVFPPGSLSASLGPVDGKITAMPQAAGWATNTLVVSDAPGGLEATTRFVTQVEVPDPAFAIPDPALAELLGLALEIAPLELTSVDLHGLTELEAFSPDLNSLSGLEWATNLVRLSLTGGVVSDLAPVQSLSGLTSLNLSDNAIWDLWPLATLTGLKVLVLDFNHITNGAALGALTNLSRLSLAANAVQDLSFLTNFNRLVELNLEANDLVDLAPLAALTNLVSLDLQQNRITDLSPLTNLWQLSFLDVRLNLLDLEKDPILPRLAARGVRVESAPQWEPPRIGVRTNWFLAPNSTATLPFAILDEGPNDRVFTLGVDSSDATLRCSLGPAVNRNCTLCATTGPLPPGVSWQRVEIHLFATNSAGLSTNATILGVVTDLAAASLALSGGGISNWSSGGDLPWFAQAPQTSGGPVLAQSGAIGDSQESWLQTSVSGPGRLTFWWKVSSEKDYDWFQFELGEQARAISGEVDWQRQVVLVPPGPQTLTWRYHKDGDWSDGWDAAWLDQVTFVPGLFLELEPVTVDGRSAWQLSWPTGIQPVWIDYAPDLASEWTVAAGPVTETNCVTLWPGDQPAGLYRLRTQ